MGSMRADRPVVKVIQPRHPRRTGSRHDALRRERRCKHAIPRAHQDRADHPRARPAYAIDTQDGIDENNPRIDGIYSKDNESGKLLTALDRRKEAGPTPKLFTTVDVKAYLA